MVPHAASGTALPRRVGCGNRPRAHLRGARGARVGPAAAEEVVKVVVELPKSRVACCCRQKIAYIQYCVLIKMRDAPGPARREATAGVPAAGATPGGESKGPASAASEDSCLLRTKAMDEHGLFGVAHGFDTKNER